MTTTTTMTIAEEIDGMPGGMVMELRGCLDVLARYREAIRRWRAMDPRCGNRGRYVVETKVLMRREVLSAVACLRGFTAEAKELGVDPAAILRHLNSN